MSISPQSYNRIPRIQSAKNTPRSLRVSDCSCSNTTGDSSRSSMYASCSRKSLSLNSMPYFFLRQHTDLLKGRVCFLQDKIEINIVLKGTSATNGIRLGRADLLYGERRKTFQGFQLEHWWKWIRKKCQLPPAYEDGHLSCVVD